MSAKQKITTPAYRKIAIDIAKNIADEKYAEGQRLSGRTLLASHYRVSPETIRKAAHILKDVGVLETEKGSGIAVVSIEKAKEFIRAHQEVESIAAAKKEILFLAKTQSENMEHLLDKLNFIVGYVERLSAVNPFNPYMIEITDGCRVIGKTVNEVQFWHNTGGTIVAIRRGDNLILSPGPYASFHEGDAFYIVGDGESYTSALGLLFG